MGHPPSPLTGWIFLLSATPASHQSHSVYSLVECVDLSRAGGRGEYRVPGTEYRVQQSEWFGCREISKGEFDTRHSVLGTRYSSTDLDRSRKFSARSILCADYFGTGTRGMRGRTHRARFCADPRVGRQRRPGRAHCWRAIWAHENSQDLRAFPSYRAAHANDAGPEHFAGRWAWFPRAAARRANTAHSHAHALRLRRRERCALQPAEHDRDDARGASIFRARKTWADERKASNVSRTQGRCLCQRLSTARIHPARIEFGSRAHHHHDSSALPHGALPKRRILSIVRCDHAIARNS